MLLSDGAVRKLGSYQEILESGFNIREIIESFNKAYSGKIDTSKETVKKFKDEAVIPIMAIKSSLQKSPTGTKTEKKQDLVMEEENIEGGVGFLDYKNMFSYSIGQSAIWIYLCISIVAALLQLVPSYAMVMWSSESSQGQYDDAFWPLTFAVSIVLFMIFSMLRSVTWIKFMLDASTSMHKKMSEMVIRSNILFFDSNPIGRITTRFSKDMSVLDTLILGLVVFVTQGALRSITVIATVCVVNPWLLIPLVIGLAYMIHVSIVGTPSMIECQKFD
jgi:ATP-binding cassette subfamily C (CFTR/MRP) protein 4